MEILQTILQAIVVGNVKEVEAKVQAALDSGVDPSRILNEGLIAGMAEVGRLYEAGEFFVPEMLIAARSMKVGMTRLKPHLTGDKSVQPIGKVAVATVYGDLHDIGKNLVGLMLEGAGFEVIDLGINVPTEKLVEAVRDQQVGVIALSALLTTTMSHMRETIQALQAAGLRDQVKIMVGGAPVTQGFADDIGADGYAPDASQAVSLAKRLIAAA
jgi:5-methyltetrahydrofolate--homocysteine methyltransferase